jgi:hypothetical protein
MRNDAAQFIYCPRCMASAVRNSHQAKFWDAVMRALLTVPLRGRSCGKRFYRRVRSSEHVSQMTFATQSLRP